MKSLDFSSWQALLSTFVGLALITLIGVGIRLVLMQTVQQRRERENRQINERLRTLIAAYKTLGGSFTGRLQVDPTHKRELKAGDERESSDRARRIRDAVEGALSDVILLGTDEQVKLAARAANELVSGRPVEIAELVVSLRNFVRESLDLSAIPEGVSIPRQGPTRPAAKGGGKAGGSEDRGQGGGRGGGGMGGMGGLGGGGIAGIGSDTHDAEDAHRDDDDEHGGGAR
ncbi:MAG: hypothetical protein HOV80_01785 [Polyangiaceae bacterium]|nr:hypothetical protein [Polyangiaceae bacterium]